MSRGYDDKAKCPAGHRHRFRILRRAASAGRVVSTYCQTCGRAYQLKAGPLPKAKP